MRQLKAMKGRQRLVLEPLESRLLLSVNNPFGTPVFTAVAGQLHIVSGTVKPTDSFDADGNGFNDEVIWYDNGSTPAPTSTVSLMLAQPGGTYHEQNIEAISQSAKIVDAELADFKNSGKPDLAVQWDSYTGSTATAEEIDIFVNNGNGTFTKTASESVAVGSKMDILDVNGDGKQDLFVENSTDDGVTVYLGNGDGTFKTGVTTTFPSGHTIVDFNTDLNGDKVVDLIVNYQTGTPMPPSYAVTSTLEVHFGKADGSFDVPADWTDPATDSYFQTVADFSGTQFPDILAYHRPTETPVIFDTTTMTETPVSTDVVVFKNDGTGHFGSAPTFTKTLAAGYENAALSVDLNNDGKLDLVLTDGIPNLGGFGSATRTIYIEKGAGDGTFTEPQTIPVDDLLLVLGGELSTDVDHDGFPDLVANIYSTDNTGTVTDWGADIFFSNHDCTFQAAVNLKPAAAPSIPAVLPVDLGNDHLLDMVFLNNPIDSGTDLATADQLFVFPNSTGKIFGAEKDVDFGANTTNGFELFDFNGDGLADAIPAFNVDANSTATGLTFWQGGDDGNFTSASSPNLFDVTGSNRAQATPNLIDFKVGGKAIDLLYVGTSPTGLYVVLNDTNSGTVGQASKLAFSQQPATTVAGATITPPVSVDVEDASGNLVTTNSSSVTLALGSGSTGTLGGTLTEAAVNGVATFSNLTVSAAGTDTLRATDGSLTSATSQTFTVTAPVKAAKLAFVQPPTNAQAGSTITPAVIVDVEDVSGNLVTSDNSNVTVTLSSGTFSDGNTTETVSASSGVATFSSLVIDAAGAYTLTAADSADSLSGFGSNGFTISPAAASQLVFTVAPANGIAGTKLAPPAKVAVEDQYGNVETGDTSSVIVGIGPGSTGSGTLGGTQTEPVATGTGVATFSNLSISATGTYTLKATDSELPGYTATSSSFTLTGAAQSLAFVKSQTTGPAGGPIRDSDGNPVTVDVLDADSQLVTSDNSHVTVTLNTGTFSDPAASGASETVAVVNGQAIFSDLKINQAGTYTLTATDSEVPSSAPTSSVIITAAVSTQLAFVQQPGNTLVGNTISPAVTVDVDDVNGDRVTTDDSFVTLAISSGTMNGTLTEQAVDGVATFSDLSVPAAGTYTLQATDDTLTAATSADFTVLGLIAEKASPDGKVLVSIYDDVSALDVDPANVKVTFGKGDSVSSISLLGSQTMDGLGLVISGATSVGSISDSRKGTPGDIAFIAADAPITSLTLKTGASGYDLDGLSLGGLTFPAEIAGDPNGLTALYDTSTVGSVTLGGMAAGDFWIGGVNAKGDSLQSFTTKNGGLQGNLVTGGAVGTLTFGGAVNGDLEMQGADSSTGLSIIKSLTINNGGFDGSLTTTGAVGTISAGEAISADLAIDGATSKGLSLQSLTIKNGGFDGSLTTTGAGGTISAGGAISADLAIDGATSKGLSLQSLTIKNGGFDGSLTTTGAVGPVSVVGGGVGGPLNIGGALKSLTVTGGAISGGISAASIGTVTVTGGDISGSISSTATAAQLGKLAAISKLSVTGGDITGNLSSNGNVGAISAALNSKTGLGGNASGAFNIGGGLTSLTLSGSLENSQLLTGGNIGTVTVESMENSVAFAGVNTGDLTETDGVWDLPSALVDFTANDAGIGSFTVKGPKTGTTTSFINSNIAAWKLGTVSLAYPDESTGVVTFGVATTQYGTVSYREASGTTTWKKSNPAATLPGDGVVRVITS